MANDNVAGGKASRREFLEGTGALAAASVLGSAEIRAAQPSPSEPVTATTEYGKIQGVSAAGVMAFLGVPYGGPVAGVARFLPPAAPQPWKETRSCIKPGPRAPQGPSSIFAGGLGPYFTGGRPDGAAKTAQSDSEDCLNLNVLTPRLQGRRPVMVYIHGGGFSSGSGALTVLSDRFVAEQDVVLVGVNHRLSVFGYTYLADLDARFADSGNAGQLDLIAALKWVKRNIAFFGGDPSNVTIFGESGGGAKISCLLAMPEAKGLFQRAIIESGSLREVRTKDDANKDAKKLLSALNLPEGQTGELLKVPTASMLKAASASGPMGFRPVVDGRSVPHQPWVPGAPPEAAGISLLVGNCKDESTLFSMSRPELYSLTWDSLRAEEIKSGVAESAVDAIIAAYREDYPAESPSDLYFRISSDRGARRNAIAQAEAKLAQGSGQVYMYHFDWNTPVYEGKVRAFHTAELPLAMRLVCYPQSEELSQQIAGAWAAFARTGSPTHKGLPTWEPYTAAKRGTMMFDVGKTRQVNDPSGRELLLLKPYPGGLL